jgi:hypothetical protein
MKKTAFILGLISTIAWNGCSKHQHHDEIGERKEETTENVIAFKDRQFDVAYNSYIQLKDALVEANEKAAQQAAADLVDALEGVEDSERALGSARKIKSAAHLADQRKAFKELSDEMLNLVKNNKPVSGQVYLVHCPMADDNRGGSWLSSLNEVRNPYYGDAMLTCGSVKETID